MMAIIGLDVGSTGCKCIIFSDAGKSMAYAYEEYPRNLSCTTISANTIWDFVGNVLSKANSEYNSLFISKCENNGIKIADTDCNGNLKIKENLNSLSKENSECDILFSDDFAGQHETVKAICISSFGESFVPVDINGNPLSDIMLYTDSRGQKECENFCNVMDEDEIMKICGVKPHRMYSLPKIEWIRKNDPDVFNKTWKFLLVEDYIIYKLTGETFIDYSLASRTMAFDVTNKCWSKTLLSLAGIDESKLSSPVPSGYIVGTIKDLVADLIGLNKNIRVVTGGHDQVCAAVGAGVVDIGTAIDGIGTVECITPAFSSPILESSFLNNNYACVPYAVPGMYVTYAFNFTGGSLLKWFRDNFAAKEDLLAKETSQSVYKILDDNAAKSPTSVIVVPHFSGSGTPDMNPCDFGTIYGLSFEHGSPEIYRALLEGVTFEMKYNMELLESVGVIIRELRAVGGGAKSKLWLKIKAAITGCTIHQLQLDEAGITGAGIMAAVAIGLFPDLKAACDVFVKIKQTITPDPELTDKYTVMYEKYKELRKFRY